MLDPTIHRFTEMLYLKKLFNYQKNKISLTLSNKELSETEWVKLSDLTRSEVYGVQDIVNSLKQGPCPEIDIIKLTPNISELVSIKKKRI